MTEYAMVGRDRWERVRASALHNGTSPHIQSGDLDPVEPVGLSGADLRALVAFVEADDAWDRRPDLLDGYSDVRLELGMRRDDARKRIEPILARYRGDAE